MTMSLNSNVSANTSPAYGLPLAYTEVHWYAVHTSANHEQRVAKHLAAHGVEHFLPLYSSLRRWKDRRVVLERPLFPGYVFVFIALRDRLQVLRIPGVARLVEFNGIPAALPEEEMQALRTGLQRGLRVLPHPYVAVGRRARIKDGPLAGLEGVVRRAMGNWRVVLSLDLIQCSVSVDMDAINLEPTTADREGQR
jgi:transcription antitermination factor NusG